MSGQTDVDRAVQAALGRGGAFSRTGSMRFRAARLAEVDAQLRGLDIVRFELTDTDRYFTPPEGREGLRDPLAFTSILSRPVEPIRAANDPETCVVIIASIVLPAWAWPEERVPK